MNSTNKMNLFYQKKKLNWITKNIFSRHKINLLQVFEKEY